MTIKENIDTQSYTPENFEKDFLHHYLNFGLGSMSKTDTETLIIYLLDQYGLNDSEPLIGLSNQRVSELLKTPVTKIKGLRYNSALKFGGDIKKQAKTKLIHALKNATLEIDNEKIHLIIEDTLAKHWLQGQLKVHQKMYDSSFNTEIVKISSESLFVLLDVIFKEEDVSEFKKSYNESKKSDDNKQRMNKFIEMIKEISTKAMGGGIVSTLI